MNRQYEFLRQLLRQSEADSDPTGRTVGAALGWNTDTVDEVLGSLVDRGWVRTVIAQQRAGDTHLDNWVLLTAEGRGVADAATNDEGPIEGSIVLAQSQTLGDRWSRTDLPVLLELARAAESDAGRVAIDDVMDALDLRHRDVMDSVDTLRRTGYLQVTFTRSGGGEFSSIYLAKEGLEATGLWPTPATGFDRMIAALEEIASNTDADEDTRTRARKIMDGFQGASRQVSIGVITAVLTGQLPGAS